MKSFITLSIILALSLTAVYGANSVSTSNWGTTPYQAVISTNTTDSAAWTANVIPGDVYLGAGTDNTTLLVWGIARSTNLDATTAPGRIYRRTLNATLLLTSTDTAGNAVTADASGSTNGIAFTATGTWVLSKFATGPGFLGHATVETTSSNDNVYVYVYSQTGTTVGASGSLAVTAATADTLAIANFWYEDGYFYVAYVQQIDSSTTQTSVGIQAVNASAPTSKLYTTAASVTLSVATASAHATDIVAGPSSNTTSSYIVVGYLSTGAASVTTFTSAVAVASGSTTTITPTFTRGYSTFTVLTSTTAAAAGSLTASTTISYTPTMAYYALVNRTAGTAASAVLNATTVPGLTFTIAGVIHGYSNTWGLALTNTTVVTPVTGSATTTYSISTSFNSTNVSVLASSTTAAVNGVWSTIYGMGFGVVTWSSSVYTWQTFFSNGSANGTAVGLGTFDFAPRVAQDINGGLWASYVVSTGAAVAVSDIHVGRFINQVLTQTSAANVLMSVIGFVSMIIASLFMF